MNRRALFGMIIGTLVASQVVKNISVVPAAKVPVAELFVSVSQDVAASDRIRAILDARLPPPYPSLRSRQLRAQQIAEGLGLSEDETARIMAAQQKAVIDALAGVLGVEPPA